MIHLWVPPRRSSHIWSGLWITLSAGFHSLLCKILSLCLHVDSRSSSEFLEVIQSLCSRAMCKWHQQTIHIFGPPTATPDTRLNFMQIISIFCQQNWVLFQTPSMWTSFVHAPCHPSTTKAVNCGSLSPLMFAFRISFIKNMISYGRGTDYVMFLNSTQARSNILFLACGLRVATSKMTAGFYGPEIVPTSFARCCHLSQLFGFCSQGPKVEMHSCLSNNDAPLLLCTLLCPCFLRYIIYSTSTEPWKEERKTFWKTRVIGWGMGGESLFDSLALTRKRLHCPRVERLHGEAVGPAFFRPFLSHIPMRRWKRRARASFGWSINLATAKPLSRECQTVNYALRTIKETGKFLLDASSSPSLSALLRLQEVFLSVSLSLKLASQLQSEHRTLLSHLSATPLWWPSMCDVH